ADLDGQVLALRRREPGELRGDGVETGREVQGAVAAALVGDEDTRHPGFDILDDDGDTRQHRLGFIGDRPGNRAGGRLGAHRARHGEHDEDQQETETHAGGQAHVYPRFGPTIYTA